MKIYYKKLRKCTSEKKNFFGKYQLIQILIHHIFHMFLLSFYTLNFFTYWTFFRQEDTLELETLNAYLHITPVMWQSAANMSWSTLSESLIPVTFLGCIFIFPLFFARAFMLFFMFSLVAFLTNYILLRFYFNFFDVTKLYFDHYICLPPPTHTLKTSHF